MGDLVKELGLGVSSAAELRRRLAISPATLMRAVRAAGPDVVRLGRARATRYGLRQSWPALEASRFPLFRVNAQRRGDAGG